MEGGLLWVASGLGPMSTWKDQCGGHNLHEGNSDPQGKIRPKAQPWDPAVYIHQPQDRAAAEIIGVSDPWLPADHQSGCKQKPSVHTGHGPTQAPLGLI